jgi:membrane associated rhomboid family serine protease
VAHLVVNMIWLAAFGSPLAARIGAIRFVLFWVATTLGAVALHFALHYESIVPLVGASGAISGMMGAAARFAFRIDRSSGKGAFAGRPLTIPAVFTNRQTLTFLAVWMVVNFVAGFGLGTPGMDGQIAWEAHVGGFVVGFLGLRLFDRPARTQA